MSKKNPTGRETATPENADSKPISNAPNTIDLLFEGVIKFKEENFLTYKELFENLKEGQNPHTLFVGLRGFSCRAKFDYKYLAR